MFRKLRSIPVETRAWIYRVLLAASPILVAAGVVGPDDAQAYLNLAAALLGVAGSALATANTPRAGQP